VQAEPREAEGIVKAVKDTRNDALRAAKDFLDKGFPFVTIISEPRLHCRGIRADHRQ
jgi:hypothetical protein